MITQQEELKPLIDRLNKRNENIKDEDIILNKILGVENESTICNNI